MTLGEKVKTARLNKGMSQRQLAGEQITRHMLSKIENGVATPSLKTIEYLAEVLELPIGYFFEEEGASDSAAATTESSLAAILQNAEIQLHNNNLQVAEAGLRAYRKKEMELHYKYLLLSGDMLQLKNDRAAAIANYSEAEQIADSLQDVPRRQEIYERLEHCWYALEDYKQAYHYASLRLSCGTEE